MAVKVSTPFKRGIKNLNAGLQVELYGVVYTARDAVLARLTELIKKGDFKSLPVSLTGAAIMHTAYSPSGFGPTSSNKEEIEGSIGLLSRYGVKLHIGKGALKQDTIDKLHQYGSAYAVAPPVSALLQSRLVSCRVVAYPEEGMEAMHELVVAGLPVVIAVANGSSIFK